MDHNPELPSDEFYSELVRIASAANERVKASIALTDPPSWASLDVSTHSTEAVKWRTDWRKSHDVVKIQDITTAVAMLAAGQISAPHAVLASAEKCSSMDQQERAEELHDQVLDLKKRATNSNGMSTQSAQTEFMNSVDRYNL